jgi:outer membrane protein TolC
VAIAAVVTGSASAQEPAQDRVKELLAEAMQQVGQTPGQTTLAPSIQAEGPRVELSVENAVARAMERNLNIASERLSPQAQDLQIAATEAFYRPNLTSAFANNSAVNLTGDIFSGGNRVSTDQQSWSGGLGGNLYWGGATYALNWTNQRQSTSSVATTCNPCFNSGLQAQFTQPLLRNFKLDNTRASLLTNRIQRQISDITLRSTIASIDAQVRNAYWELVYSYQALEAAQRSLDLSTKLVQDNRARVEIGTMAPIDVVQAQAEEATRRQAVVSAQATLRNNELALKRLIVGGTEDELWRSAIFPTDRPAPTAEPIDMEAALRNALQNRTDLETTRKNIETSDVQLRTFVNQTLPQLDLIADYRLNGRGGLEIERNRLTQEIISTHPGGYVDALRAISAFDAPTWNVRMQFAWPIGTSAAEANVARQRVLRRQTETLVKTTELQIATEIASAVLNIRNSLEAIQASTASRDLAEKRLEAAQSKFEVGMATNFEVVQAQRDLFDARNRELREQLNYQRALVDFQRAQISPR